MSELSELQHNVERKFKKWLGNHEDGIKAIGEKIKAIVDAELMDFIQDNKERAFELIQEYSKGMATRELFDVFIKALEDAIAE
ncbi:hypothetical protein [Sulfuricurvum sp.]|uniref:hypothetical protein n=1 Tax=Sulfuricurvum sp. TaxID=2025608 RepID=UPI003565340C